MRMWMVHPSLLCRSHLLGEHKELHMLAGSLARGKRLDGHLASGQLAPQARHRRHARLVTEFGARGYQHASPLPAGPTTVPRGLVDPAANLDDLWARCPACRARIASAVMRSTLF